MTTESTAAVESEASLRPTPLAFLVVVGVAYAEPEVVVYCHKQPIQAESNADASEQADAFARAVGIRHGAQALDNVDLDALSLADLRDILLTLGIHLGEPSLMDPEDAVGV